MAVDIKKVLTSLTERKETMLVWGLGAVALCLGVFLLAGYTRETAPPSSLEVVVKRKKPLKSKEEITEEAIAKLKESQKIPPFTYYQEILSRSLFLRTRRGPDEDGPILQGKFSLKGTMKIASQIKAHIQAPDGKGYLVEAGQMIGTTGTKVLSIPTEKSIVLLSKGAREPVTIRMKEEVPKEAKKLVFKPTSAVPGKEVVKDPEEEAKKAIATARKLLSEASDVILTARSEGVDTDEAEARRDDAKVKLQDAQRAMREGEYKEAEESAKSAQALAREAKRLVGEAEGEHEKDEKKKREEDEEDKGGKGKEEEITTGEGAGSETGGGAGSETGGGAGVD